MTLIQFDDGSGRRISDAVRFIEDQANKRKPLTYAPFLETGRRRGNAIRLCTFTGSWSINELKTITIANQSVTPNTVSAQNFFWPVPDSGGPRDCVIARDGTTWYLVVPRVFAANVATAATLSSTALRFDTVSVVALSTATAGSFSVSVAECSTAS